MVVGLLPNLFPGNNTIEDFPWVLPKKPKNLTTL